ncbi:hypothetical protein D3C72_1986560 [compost metagenome]
MVIASINDRNKLWRDFLAKLPNFFSLRISDHAICFRVVTKRFVHKNACDLWRQQNFVLSSFYMLGVQEGLADFQAFDDFLFFAFKFFESFTVKMNAVREVILTICKIT